MKQQFLNWALLVTLLLAFQEAVVRAIFPLPEVTNFNRVNYAAFARDHASSFLAKRQPAMNAAFRWNSKPDNASFVSHLNLYGFRDRQWNVAPKGGVERVIFVGDSLTEGFMAKDDETIPRGYEHTAKAAPEHLEAMNFGIGGNGIPEYLDLIHDAVPLFRPRKLIVVIYANDFPVNQVTTMKERRPFQPQHLNAWTPRLLQTLTRAARREPVPRLWHSRPVLFAPVVPDPLNPWSHPPPEFSRVDPAFAEAMRRGEFNPFVVDLLHKCATELRKPVDLSATLEELQSFTRQYSAELSVVYLPFATQVSDYYIPFEQHYALHKDVTSLLGPEYQVQRLALARNCRQLAIPFLDLTPLLRKAETEGGHLYWSYDEHMRGSTYLRVGTTIFQWLHSNKRLETLAP